MNKYIKIRRIPCPVCGNEMRVESIRGFNGVEMTGEINSIEMTSKCDWCENHAARLEVSYSKDILFAKEDE